MTDILSGFKQNSPWDSLMQYGVSTPKAFLGSGLYDMGLSNTINTGVSKVADPTLWEKLIGYKTPEGTTINGFGGLALGAASGLGNLWMGMKNYGLAKDQLAFQEDAYAKNYAAQKQTTNASLEDRQRARVAANPAAYASVSDYMAKNGIA